LIGLTALILVIDSKPGRASPSLNPSQLNSRASGFRGEQEDKMVNHPLRSRTNRTAANCNVYSIAHDQTGPVHVDDIAKGLTFDAASKRAKKIAGRGAECSKYGPTSLCYIGNGVTVVVSW
jgi:hypothetical protein